MSMSDIAVQETEIAVLVARLTPLQMRFAEEYLLDLNATQAAIRAGCNNSTYGSASVSGHEFLSNPNVQEYIQYLRKERSQKTKIDAAWLLERLAAEADADVADLYDEFGAVRPVHEWPLMFRKGLVAGIEIEEQYDEVDDPEAEFRDPDNEDKPRKVRRAVGRVVKLKLDSRVKRLELIGRHIGVKAFVEQIDLNAKVDVRAEIDVKMLSEDQLKTIAGIKVTKELK